VLIRIIYGEKHHFWGMEGTDKAGWMGLKSVPSTLADGKAEAKLNISLSSSLKLRDCQK
jgi:hypothetical protein